MLMGEFKHNIDSKGRLIIPAKLREELGDRFIVTRGLDGCVFGYPLDVWEQLHEKLSQLPLARKQARAFTRFLYSAACEVTVDKQGRINLPANLIEYALLQKNCCIVGVSNRIEIWDETEWQNFTSGIGESYEELAEDLFDLGI